MAQHSGAWLIPVHVASEWHLETWSWDRQQIPLPFSRVVIRYGEAIPPPSKLDRRAAERLCEQLERRYEQETTRLTAEVGRGEGS